MYVFIYGIFKERGVRLMVIRIIFNKTHTAVASFGIQYKLNQAKDYTFQLFTRS